MTPVPGFYYNSAFATLTGGADDTVYTVTDPSILLTGIRCVDDGGAARTVEVIFTRSATDRVLVPTASAIAANAALDTEFKPCIVLLEGDVIKATGSAAGVEVAVTFVTQGRRS